MKEDEALGPYYYGFCYKEGEDFVSKPTEQAESLEPVRKQSTRLSKLGKIDRKRSSRFQKQVSRKKQKVQQEEDTSESREKKGCLESEEVESGPTEKVNKRQKRKYIRRTDKHKEAGSDTTKKLANGTPSLVCIIRNISSMILIHT